MSDYHDDEQRIARIEAENEHAVLDPDVMEYDVAWIRHDDRCVLKYRVMHSWRCYDTSPQAEAARFASWDDARAYIKSKGWRMLRASKEASDD
ncbi:MAG: hypothetical protein M0R37_10435 [Bacteroidales bacterium]|jgi:hypothetical protein|nr:hypothetical protein [Bacteroidales bacterium]